MEEVRVALIGCGLIGRTHARCLRALGSEKVRLVAAIDRDPARAEKAAADFGFAHATSDAAGALARSDVNAVWIGTPTDAHPALLDMALHHRHAVFCEKPLAHTAAQAQAMADAVSAARVPCQVGMVLRYSPLFLALREALRGERVMTAVFRDDQCLPLDGHYASQWRADVGVAGGGTVIEHSIHDLDLLRWYFGEVRTVWASTSFFAGHRGIEDVANAVLRFASGVTASLVSVWHRMPHRRSDRRLEIFCETSRVETVGDFHGTLEIERDADRIERREVGRAPSSSSEVADFESDAYLFENEAFVQALLEGRTPTPGFEEAVAAHRLVDALYESARSGSAIAP